MKLKTLIRKARIYCDWRYHDMKPFRAINHHCLPFATHSNLTIKEARQAYSECRVCRRTCTVSINPLPNEADMMGEALALECN